MATFLRESRSGDSSESPKRSSCAELDFLNGFVVTVLPDLAIYFDSILEAIHQLDIALLVAKAEFLVELRYSTVLRNRIADTPRVDLPRLLSLVLMKLKHLRGWSERWQECDRRRGAHQA